MILLLLATLGPLAHFRMEGEGAATTGATTTTSAATTASPATTGTTSASSTGTPPPVASSTTAQPSDSLTDGNWKEMRTRLTTAEQRAALLDQLDGVNDADLPIAWKQFTAMKTEGATIGKALGYTDAELKEAFDADPVFALSQLRQAKADADAAARVTQKPGETQINYEKRIQEEVAKQTKPFTDHINKQLSDAIVGKIGEAFTISYDAALPNTPPEVRDLVKDYVDEYLVANPNLIVAMKARGDYSSIDSAIKVVAGRLTSVFKAWVQAETTRTGGRPAASTTPGSPTTPVRHSKYTLDDIIDDPGVLGAQYR